MQQAEQEAERRRQQEAEEAVRHAGPRAIEHDAQAPAAASRGLPVPGNVLDPESTAAAAAAVAAAAAPQQRGQFGKAGRGRSYSNGALLTGCGMRASTSHTAPNVSRAGSLRSTAQGGCIRGIRLGLVTDLPRSPAGQAPSAAATGSGASSAAGRA